MISDDNFVQLSGVVSGNVFVSEDNGEPVLNVTLESKKYNKAGQEKFFLHPVVIFPPKSIEFQDKIKNGVFVKGRAHLMSQELMVLDRNGNPTSRLVDRVVLDYIEVDEE